MPFKLYVVSDNLNKFCSKQTNLATASQICPWEILGEKKNLKKIKKLNTNMVLCWPGKRQLSAYSAAA